MQNIIDGWVVFPNEVVNSCYLIHYKFRGRTNDCLNYLCHK